MSRRVLELERESADWLEQLYTADFAVAAFFVGLLSAYGALRVSPHTQKLCGELRPLGVLRFFTGTAPTGLTYWCVPPRRTVLLTVWRISRIPEACEQRRAQHMLAQCTRHGPDNHQSWDTLCERRMAEPGAAEVYHDTALAFDFGQQVRLRRIHRHLSPARLAAAADTSAELILRCEAGGLLPGTPVGTRIAHALDLSRPDMLAATPNSVPMQLPQSPTASQASDAVASAAGLTVGGRVPHSSHLKR
ncbi:multiprotein-bridging factor 1 family protein [Actinomadura sp. 6N118]|uniref:multiprotein-bridging factor 1 family protein n=1 Tax=Actinomadura sp. 6N118 TaxID=3375151 RepID=UPI0037A6C6A3